MSASFFAKAIPCRGKWLWLPALFALIGPPNAVAAETSAGAGLLEPASHAAKPSGASAKVSKKPAKEEETLPALSRAGAGRMIRVVATGYTAGVESTGKRPGHPQYGITFSGVKVRRGRLSTIAADPKLFPIGTILYIPGYGYGIVADTGSRIKGRKIDLYFPSRKQVFREWGKRSVEVRVIRRGSGKLTEPMFESIGKLLVAAEGQSTPG